MSYLTKNAGDALKARLEEVAGDRESGLDGEVDLARVMAVRALQIYDRVCIQDPKEGEKTPSDQLKAMAVEGMRGALEFVTSIVERRAKVSAITGRFIPVEQIGFMVQQVMDAIEKVVAPVDPVLARQVCAEIEQIKLPGAAEQHKAVRTTIAIV